MKTKCLTGFLVLALTAAGMNEVQSQQKKETVGQSIDKTGKAIEKTATKVGNKTAEVAVKGSAKVVDQTFKGKMAPDGSNVYIDGKNRKYYINKKGARVYLKSSEIKDRPKS